MNKKELARVNKMDAESLQAKLDEGGFSAIDRPVIESLINEKREQTAGTGDVEVAVEENSKEEKPEAEKGPDCKPLDAIQELQAEAKLTAETPATEGSATETPTAQPSKKEPKHKPNETTYTVEKFTDDTKGIRVGDTVSFPSSNKPDAIIMEGTVQRIFRFYREDREEAKIKGTDKKRYYRFEKNINLVSHAVTSQSPEATVEQAAEVTVEPVAEVTAE